MRTILGILLCLVIPLSASAAPAGNSKARATLRKKYFQGTFGYNLWHEAVAASSGGNDGNISMSFHGFKIGGAYLVPYKQLRWVQYYAADVSFGNTKGTGDGAITDQLREQPWYAATVTPGLIFRSTALSELGVILPLAYRQIDFKLDSGASLQVDDKPFSVGVGAMFINRFTTRSSLMLALTHQHMWNATIWGMTYTYDFK